MNPAAREKVLDGVGRLRRARIQHRPGPRYILVTQCLQNDFFRNQSCRLGLPKFVVRDMLVGKQHLERSKAGSEDGRVLAYQSQRLQEYLGLMERRALKVYDTINLSNRFLIGFGVLFLLATLGFAVASAVTHGRTPWELTAVTGGLSLAQFVGVFFRTPTKDLHDNLRNLAEFRMKLESRSLKTAIIRFHLTTARTLRPIETAAHARAAARQIDTLKKQLDVIGGADRADWPAGELDLVEQAQADGDVEAAAPDVTNGAGRAEAR